MIKKGELDIREYSSLALAYMGDCIFDLYVRTYILKMGNMQANKLHKRAKELVCASTQSMLYLELIEIECITEEEKKVLRRGKNANANTKAKNATIVEYKNATGLEALFGYLYLKGENKRIDEIFKICLDIIKRG